MSMLFTDHYFLLVSLLPSMVGDELIDEHLDEDKEKSKMEMVLVDREKKKQLSSEKIPDCPRSPFTDRQQPAQNLKMVLGSFSTLGFCLAA